MTVTDQLIFSKNALNNYAQKIGALIDQEVATEESFYPDFRDLLKNYFSSNEFEVISVPKAERTEDKPDYIIYMDNIPIINIEAKNPYDPIDKWILATSKNRLFEQVYRYRGCEASNIPVIITDFLQIWVINNDSPNSMDSDHQIKYKFKIVDDSSSIWKSFSNAKKNFEIALDYACKDIVLSIAKVSSMIKHLVRYAKELKTEIIEVFKDPSNPMKTYLESIREDFLESIFSSDKEKKSQEFADLFAQTLIYGGFIAWMRFCKDGNNSKDFNFNIATKYLPYGNFTYNLFADISIKSSPKIQENIISKIERIFQSSKFEKITQNTEALMITFYSDFLKLYDPQMAKDRGIVFTPHPIINFITRSVEYLLKNYFNKPEGITSSGVFFLDPAAGTMGFLCEIIRLAKNYFKNEFSKQPSRINNEFNDWVHKSFLENTYAFEILMAPYVLGHLRINMLLDELGAEFNQSKDRVKLYLFNTLMELQTTLQDFRNPAIGEEIVEALNIRNRQEILVVLSNPPYNISSQNKFKWIEEKINYEPNGDEIDKNLDENAKRELILEIKKQKNDYFWDLQREGTKKITGYKAIQDDYVKFIRFAQWKIKQNKYGIIAYITNNYYINGLIFRGMRSSLRRDFDKIWIIDLHGDARKSIPKSVQIQGIKKDENVFRIKTGVAIAFFIRTQDHSDNKCDIKYIDTWGSKVEKFEFLSKNIDEITFQEISERIDYEFCPDKFTLRYKYMKFTYLIDIFKKHIQGIVSGNDMFISDIDRKSLENRIKEFFENKIEVSTKSWDYEKAKMKTTKDQSLQKIIKWVYRGFDIRYICYNAPLIVRDRYELMQYLSPPNNTNFSLIINRQNRSYFASSFFISDTLFDNKCNEGASGLHSYAFPLKINDCEEPDDFNNPKMAINSNIHQEFKSTLKFNKEITDEQMFFYIYALLYAPTYRKRYYLGLMEDYPRIPFPDSKDIFIDMSKLGKRLADLHLFKAKDLDHKQFEMSRSTDYKIYYVGSKDKDNKGNQIPDTYDPITQRIYFKKRLKSQIQMEKEGDRIDDITWIGGITQAMWDFEIGGRQQLKQWLFARRFGTENKKNTIPRPLTNEELEYFLVMCDAIKKTIEILPEIDTVYKKIDP